MPTTTARDENEHCDHETLEIPIGSGAASSTHPSGAFEDGDR